MKTELYILICISCICIGCAKKEKEYGVATRPENFPDILVPVESAIETRYLSPETGNIVKGVYKVSFWIDEEYPAKNTIEKIRSHLYDQGCIRIKGSVLNDLSSLYLIEGEGLNKRVVDITEELKRDIEKTRIPTETQWQRPEPLADYAKIIHSRWHEEWITPGDDKVSVYLAYYFPDKGYEDYRIWVHLDVFTPSSWMYPHVQRYKENHPEEFTDSNGLEKSPGD